MIKVVGWYNRRNIGDESYKLSFPKLFPKATFEFGDTPGGNISVLGGGHVLSKSFLESFARSNASRKIAISVSASPETPKELLSQFETILVRDVRTLRNMESWGIPARLMPDVSVCMEPNPERGRGIIAERFEAEGLELYKIRVAVILNAHLYYREKLLARDYMTCLKAMQDIARVADDTSASFIFVPMSTGQPYDDRAMHGFINAHCKWWRKNWVIHERFDVQQTLDILSSCNVIISSRLHSSIFALISHVPFIDLLHHDKMLGFLETVGWREDLCYWNFSAHELAEKLTSNLDRERASRSKLELIHQEQLALLMKEAQNVRLSE